MSKGFFVLLNLILASTSITAYAESASNSADNPIADLNTLLDNMDNQIQQEMYDGVLTPEQAQLLQDQAQSIRDEELEMFYDNNGVISDSQLDDLNLQAAELSQEINTP